jgi:hypothetical protein
MMKRIILIGLILAFYSCSIPNDNENFTYEIEPVYSVTMPTKFAVDSVTVIPVKYKRPSSCHFFNDFYYNPVDFTRTVAIGMLVSNSGTCQPDNTTLVEVSLKFKPKTVGTYHFKFWTGNDANGVEQFQVKDVLVNH